MSKTLEELAQQADKILALADTMQDAFASDKPEYYRDYLKIAIMVGLSNNHNLESTPKSEQTATHTKEDLWQAWCASSLLAVNFIPHDENYEKGRFDDWYNQKFNKEESL